MKVLIVSGGNPPKKDIFLEEMKSSDILIGADRGRYKCFKV